MPNFSLETMSHAQFCRRYLTVPFQLRHSQPPILEEVHQALMADVVISVSVAVEEEEDMMIEDRTRIGGLAEEFL